MPHPHGLSQWQECGSPHLPQLSAPQRQVLALWRFGVVLAQRCGLTTVAVRLAALFPHRDQTLIHRLRDGERTACHTTGAAQGCTRRAADVTAGCAPVLRCALPLPPADGRTRALAMDAATLGQRFTIRTLSVVIRGSAIPSAWNIIPATVKGAWRPRWEGRFAQLHAVTPADGTVIVLADRGGSAPWLVRTSVAMARHPFLRIHRQGQYRPAGATDDPPLTPVVRKGGPAWSGRVTWFTTRERQLDCTLLARWDAADAEPWRILTDLPPRQADARWSGMRAGIAGGSKDATRGGWHGERTNMTDPQRAERRWLAMALATVWVVRVGCAAEVAHPAPQVAAVPAPRIARQRARGRRAPRALRCFRRGRLVLLTAVLHGDSLPVMRVIPEPWPKRRDTAHAPPSELSECGRTKTLHLRGGIGGVKRPLPRNEGD